jgi:hypothetical protein
VIDAEKLVIATGESIPAVDENTSVLVVETTCPILPNPAAVITPLPFDVTRLFPPEAGLLLKYCSLFYSYPICTEKCKFSR